MMQLCFIVLTGTLFGALLFRFLVGGAIAVAVAGAGLGAITRTSFGMFDA
jgi:hypothetical protein